MANLLLTEKCVRNCPYCFARDHMTGSGDRELSWDNLIYVADFMEASGDKKLSLLGGEPTLHPQFVDFTLYLLARGFRVSVFTSGILSKSALDNAAGALDRFSHEQLQFVCNINDPEQTGTPEAETDALHRFLSVFGPQTAVSFNIYRVDFQMDYVISCVNRYGMNRNLRLGLAHPIPESRNQFVSPEALSDVFRRLAEYMPLFDRHRIRIGFDCGFPLCKVDDALLAPLFRSSDNGIRFKCGSAIDIGPDLSLWSCFPLGAFHKRSLLEFNSMREILDFYLKRNQAIRSEIAGIYEACEACRFREEDRCSGGCLAHLLIRMQDAPQVRGIS